MGMTISDSFLFSQPNSSAIYTPEDFTDEDVLIAKTADLFVENEILPKIESIDQGNQEAVIQLFQKSGELGLLSIEVPEKYGGLSLTKTTSGLVAEKVGFGGSFSVSFNIHAGVGTLPYIYYGTEKQKKKYLPLLSSGEWIGAYALTEPNAGSDALSAKAKAVKQEDGSWLLNGEKQWITNASIADVFVVFAKTEEGMTAFIVEKSYKGVSVGTEEKKMGIKGSSTATLILDNVPVPADNVLGDLGKGHLVALNILNLARLKLAFANIGAAKQSLQLAINYASERTQFRKPIIDFSMIQEKLAQIAIAIFGAESAAYRTAGEIDRAIESNVQTEINKIISPFALECAINKVYCSEILAHAVDEAVQIHGGNGYMQEYAIERLYRDARISRIFEGTNEINRLTIAKSLVKRYQTERNDLIHPGSPNGESSFLKASKQLINIVLQTLTESSVKIEEEQEYARLLADMAIQMYIIESAWKRTEQMKERKLGSNREEVSRLSAEVLAEEGFRQMRGAAITVISGMNNDEKSKENLLLTIRKLPAPLYGNIFAKKRRIAAAIKENQQYFL